MGHHLGVSFGEKARTLPLQFFTQLPEIFDDAVVHDCQPIGRVRMGVALAWPSMGGPAGMSDPDRAFERLALQFTLQIAQLALDATTFQPSAFECGNACRIVAAIFEPFERVNEVFRDRLATEDADNPAHGRLLLLLLLLPARALARPQARGAVLLDDLAFARDRQCIRRDIVGNNGAGRDVSAVADS